MQLSIDEILTKAKPFILLIKKYASFLFILIFLMIYVYLVQRIGYLIQQEPSQSAIDSKAKPVNQLKVDQDAVRKITDLESQNIEIKSLFDQARDNPFTE
jgi:hypothetical protein